MREGLPPLPESMRALPLDCRSYPIPRFVAWYDGKPGFRVADVKRMKRAIYEHLCWICGGHISDTFVFVRGASPLSNRTALEPPCHRACAEFAVVACPFVSLPKAQYKPSPEGTVSLAGGVVERTNPGVMMLWMTKQFRPWGPPSGGLLIEMGRPEEVLWSHEGRRATEDEIERAIS